MQAHILEKKHVATDKHTININRHSFNDSCGVKNGDTNPLLCDSVSGPTNIVKRIHLL